MVSKRTTDTQMCVCVRVGQPETVVVVANDEDGEIATIGSVSRPVGWTINQVAHQCAQWRRRRYTAGLATTASWQAPHGRDGPCGTHLTALY